MNILVFCKKIPFPPTDGESIVIGQDLLVLNELGYNVHLFCLNTKKHYIDLNSIKIPDYIIDFQSFEIDTFSFSQFSSSIFSKFPFHLARFFNPKLAEILDQFIKKNSIETILFQGLPTTLYLDFLTQKTRNIYRSHNLEHRIWNQLAENSKFFLKKLALKLLSNSLKKYELTQLAKFESIISLSNAEATVWEKQYASVSESIPICIDSRYTSSYNMKNEGLLFIGSLDWAPNKEGLNWFLDTIYPFISEIPLTIAGKGSFKAPDFKKLKVISNFKSLEDLVSSHKMMIVPLHSGAGIRIKILEALDYGIPILSSTIGADGIDFLENNPEIVNNSFDWIDKIKSIYYDETKLNNMHLSAKKTIDKHYHRTLIASKWKSVLEF